MSRHWFLFSLAALAGAAGTMEIPAAQPSDTATIVVRVPADAKVYFDDTLTEKSGSERSFVTPGLQPGQIFFYTIKAEVTRDGKALTQSQRAGGQVTVFATDWPVGNNG
jgi:uncharacterized protein (TIGR03000 family)